MKANIRILKAGLTVGSTVYSEGEIVAPPAQTHDLVQLANGKKHVGHIWAEWVTEPKPVATMEAPAEEVATHVEPAVAEPAPTPVPVVDTQDLTAAIKDLVSQGLGKRKIQDQLGATETYTHKGVGEEFDRLVAIGQIISGDAPGKYSVA